MHERPPGQPGEPPPADGEPAGDSDVEEVERGDAEPGPMSEEVDRAQEREEEAPEG